jgi:hypothetical protein
MGYRMSNQGALDGYFPYSVMHGRQPMLTVQGASPPAVEGAD